MKANKKAVLSAAAVLGVAGLVAGGTIAYFTDTKTETNTFTVGDVKITMYESQLHRQNSGRMGNFPALASDSDYCDWNASSSVTTTAGNDSLINGSYESARYCTPNMGTDVYYAADITAVAAGHTASNRSWGFSDAQIITDAADYKAGADTTDDTTDDGYFTRVSQEIVPGAWVRKFTYVKNNDASSDAYVLIRYMVPTAYADNIEVKIPGTPYEEDTDANTTGVQGYFTAVNYDATNGYSAYALTASGIDGYTGYIQEIDGTEYRVYAAVTTQALEPGEMTFWSPVNNVRLKTTVINTDTTDPNYVAPASQVDVKVDAQAIQAKTFSSAVDAINAL